MNTDSLMTCDILSIWAENTLVVCCIDKRRECNNSQREFEDHVDRVAVLVG